MKIWDRLVGFIAGLLLMEMAIILSISITDRGEYLLTLTQQGFWWISGNVIITLLVTIYIFSMVFRRRREEKTIISQTKLGEIRIAVSAVESLAMRACKRVKGVKDAHVGVRAEQSGLDVFIEITAHPDLVIPEISEEIKVKVDDYIYETIGMRLNSVKVLVTKVANEARARVE